MAPFHYWFFVGLIAAAGSEAFAPVAAPRKLTTRIKTLPPLCQRRSERPEDENFFVPDRVLRPIKSIGYNLKAVFGEIAYAAGTQDKNGYIRGYIIIAHSLLK